MTLYCQSLEESTKFYSEVLDLEVLFQDSNSCVFDLGGVMINLIHRASANELVAPMDIAEPDSGSASLFTIQVSEVDHLANSLKAKGAKVLNGPINRAWGIRTLTISDPSGYAWEFSAPLLDEPKQ
jgi:uncharacterized glyoxalase superfamily protein PhnB